MARPGVQDGQPPGGAAGAGRGHRVPLRDYFLLPMIALATVLFMAFAVEGAARVVWPESLRNGCDRPGPDGGRERPNCVARAKIFDGPWVDYRYNDCGYRAATACAAPPRGGLRVAVVGTSVSGGYLAPYPESFAGRAADRLSRACGRPVDFQTVGLIRGKGFQGSLFSHVAARVPEALATKPDALVTVIVPYDLEEYSASPTSAPSRPTPAAAPPRRLGPGSLKAMLKTITDESRAAHVAQHYFYLDLDRYIPLYLKHGDAADFLRPPFSPAWRDRLAMVRRVVSASAQAAHAAHVPFVVVFMPSRAQAALTGARVPKGIDTAALGDTLGAIVRGAGGEFVDLTREVQRIPAQADLYYPVDGHPAAASHAIIARALERQLVTDGSAFAGCRL